MEKSVEKCGEGLLKSVCQKALPPQLTALPSVLLLMEGFPQFSVEDNVLYDLYELTEVLHSFWKPSNHEQLTCNSLAGGR